MEYDPKHKASSIASNTSSSSESTWDFPLNNYPEDDNIFIRESQNFEDYSALERLVVPEIDLEALEKQNTEYRLFNAVEDQKFNDFLSSFNEEVPDLITPHAKRTDDTNMKKVNHEKLDSNMEIFSRRPDQASNVTPSSSNDKYDVSSSPTLPIYLQQSDQITVPALSASRKRRQSSASLESHLNRFIQPKTSSSPAVTTLAHAESEKPDIKRTKTTVVSKDLLSEDEKRLNHIASEQKRRNTIRSGFKELTEIIPTLKNINNSKSTILFKAVEYIKHLDRRNRGLREKLSSLHLRMNVATRNQERSRASRKLVSRSMHHQHSFIQGSSSENARHSDDLRHLPANTISALMAHKNQQRQLEMLQEQLRAQQQLLVKHNIQPYASSPGYHSISIPNHENRHSSALALVVPQDEEDPSWHSSF